MTLKKLVLRGVAVFIIAIGMGLYVRAAALHREYSGVLGSLSETRRQLQEAEQVRNQLAETLLRQEQDLRKERGNVDLLEQEKTELEGRIASLENYLTGSSEALEEVRTRLIHLEEHNEGLVQEVELLRGIREQLEQRVNALNEEKLTLESSLKDPAELRKALKRMREQRRLVRIEATKRKESEESRVGNSGFVVLDAECTLGALGKTRVRVLRAD